MQWNSPQKIGAAVFLSLIALGSGCTPENDTTTASSGAIEHPTEARIPRHEQAVSITTKQTLTDLSNAPKALKTLSAFLDDPSTVDTTRVDVLVEESQTVEIASVSPTRLALLGGHPENRLYEHNLRTGTTTQIATHGGGPGQLKFAEALARSDTSIYVARQDRRIDRFDCADAPCTYEESARLRFSPMALTTAASHLATTGIPMLNRTGMKLEEWSGAIQVLGPTGTIEHTFGHTYQTNHFLVLSAYTRDNSLIYSESLGQFVRASEDLPVIWTYKTDGSPGAVWKITGFDPLPIQFFPSEQRRHKESQDGYSLLRLQGPIAGRFVVATVKHMSPPSSPSDPPRNGTDYYALDLQTDDAAYLGHDSPREDIVDRLFLVTNEHQVLIENGQVAVITGN